MGSPSRSSESLGESTEDFFADFKFHEHKMRAFNFNQESGELEQAPETDPSESKILEPDHPLLERYQKALKEHISKQLYKHKASLLQDEESVKERNSEREQLGVEVYECQQLVNKQLNDIDECVRELETYTASREEAEHELELTNEAHKEIRIFLQETEKKEIVIRNEVESTNMLLNSLKKWEEDIESDLLVNQRMADKTRKDKVRLATEKKQQDIIIYKLMEEVWRLEVELEEMVMQINSKEDEREKNALNILQSNIDIEANEADQKCLMSGWQSIIATIATRDKHYNNLIETYNALELKLGVLNGEIRQVKKLISKELVQNESLTIFKERIESERRNVNRLLNIEIQKRDNFEKCLMQYESIIERVGVDVETTKNEIAGLMLNNNATFREFEKLSLEKVKLEEAIFNCMDKQVNNNKTAGGLMKIIRVRKEKVHEIEIKLAKLSNKMARVKKECQQQELEERISSDRVKELHKQLSLEDAELMRSMKDITKCTLKQEKKCGILQLLKRKLDRYLSGTDVDMSPQETKIRSLEGQISDCREKNKGMQMFWLREQAIVVDLSQKRQDQIKDLNILSKQIKILDQKILKINDAVEDYNNQEDKLNRRISALQNKLVSNQDSLNKKKSNKDVLDEGNNFTQMSLITKLEDSEFESLKLKAEIMDIQDDKVVLSNELIERNREALCWERKILMAVEAKKNIKSEAGDDGEVGRMKTEIHRMNVRYSHLKRAQDKLIKDLEQTVYRREAIYVHAKAKTQHLKGSALQHVKLAFTYKLDEYKNRLQQVDNEIEEIIKNIQSKHDALTSIDGVIADKKDEIKEIEGQYAHKIRFYNNKLIDKQLNLDILLFKQRKLKVYSELARGRTPFLIFKQPSSVYQREKDLNAKLRYIVENLEYDFPAHFIFLSKVRNSLTLLDLNL